MNTDYIDILYIRTKTENSVTVAFGNERFGPYPTKGALAVAAKEMYAKHPEIWTSERDCGTALMLLHFIFIEKGKNVAEFDYPYKGDEL